MKKLKPESVGGRTRNVEGGYRKGKSMGCGKVLGFDAMEEVRAERKAQLKTKCLFP